MIINRLLQTSNKIKQKYFHKNDVSLKQIKFHLTIQIELEFKEELIKQTKNQRYTNNSNQRRDKYPTVNEIASRSSIGNQLVKKIQKQLGDIKKVLSSELQRTVKKLETKLKQHYLKTLSQTFVTFYLQSYIAEEVNQINTALSKLKQKINEYTKDFCHNILSRNIKKNSEVSLFHYQNTIKTLEKTWHSASSRRQVNIAEIKVQGFSKPQTSWLALGVTKKLKQFGPIESSFNKEDFMGNIYLNGSDQLMGYRVKKDLNNGDIFVVECQNRMVWVYRRREGKNQKEAFIMDDNVQYYIYIAIKGPIQLTFQAQ